MLINHYMQLHSYTHIYIYMTRGVDECWWPLTSYHQMMYIYIYIIDYRCIQSIIINHQDELGTHLPRNTFFESLVASLWGARSRAATQSTRSTRNKLRESVPDTTISNNLRSSQIFTWHHDLSRKPNTTCSLTYIENQYRWPSSAKLGCTITIGYHW